MDTYKITGGKKISGSVDIHGSKNAVLPLMAASFLVKGVTLLHNCPDISDVYYMASVLEHLGCKIEYSGRTVSIDASDVSFLPIPTEMIKGVRASILFMGALLARNHYVEIDYPGGCMIGSRPVDYHIQVLRKLGADFEETEDRICCSCKELTGTDIRLKFPSVGATENALLAAACAKGTTIIYNAAREPEIVELCKLLSKMGVITEGAGTSKICVVGCSQLKEAEHVVSCDRIVAGTYLCAGAISHGSVCCKMNNPQDLCGLTRYFRKMGCKVRGGNDYYEICSGSKIKAIDYIETKPYPGFPTDMQSQFMSVLSKADGKSMIVENVFESRFHTVPELVKMGADIKINDYRACICGKNAIKGTTVVSRDLRGAAALIIAGLGAEGETTVKDNGYIKRGYERIAEDINSLGGRINCD